MSVFWTKASSTSARKTESSAPTPGMAVGGREADGGHTSASSPPGGGGPKVTAAGGPSAVGTGGGMPSRCALSASPAAVPSSAAGKVAAGAETRREVVAAGAGTAGDGSLRAPCVRQRGGGHRRSGLDGDAADAQQVRHGSPGPGTGHQDHGDDEDRGRGQRQRAAKGRTLHEGPRRLQPGDHPIGQLGLAGEVQRVGQGDEGAFQVDGHRTAPPSSARSRSSARDRRDFTVPGGTSSAAAVSASDRPAK